MNFAKQYSKTIGAGGCGKCRVYYSPKYKRNVVEKTVDDKFLNYKKGNKARTKSMISAHVSNEILLRKEMIFMLLTKIAKLDCCVEILGFEENPFRIIMEYCEGGDVRKILDTYEVPVSDKMTIISQFLLALKRIHENKFIHGDLKSANIFLVKKYVPGDYKNIKVKIGDFGLSELGGDLVFGGTPGFMAPEVRLIGGSFDSDIYSAGKVMLEIMTQLPVEMIQVINSNNIFTLRDKLPKFMNITQFYDIVITCLNIDYKKRPNANEVYEFFHAIITLWLVGETTNLLILKKYHLGETVPVYSHPHPLIVSNAEMRGFKGDGWFCDICRNKPAFFNNMLAFHCKICDFDLCYKCICKYDYRVVNGQMLKRVSKGQKIYVTTHPHYLLLKGKEERYQKTGKDYTWLCDICKIKACSSVYSFHCEKCGYDVCFNCFGKYFQVRKDEKGCCVIF